MKEPMSKIDSLEEREAPGGDGMNGVGLELVRLNLNENSLL
jgi:hypothetical protein